MSRKLKEVPKLVLLILLNFSAYKLRNVWSIEKNQISDCFERILNYESIESNTSNVII